MLRSPPPGLVPKQLLVGRMWTTAVVWKWGRRTRFLRSRMRMLPFLGLEKDDVALRSREDTAMLGLKEEGAGARSGVEDELLLV